MEGAFKVLLTLSEKDLDKCRSPFLHSSTKNLQKVISPDAFDILLGKKFGGHRNYLWETADCRPDSNIQCSWQCLYCSICTLFLLETLTPFRLWEAAGLRDCWQKNSASHTGPRIQMFEPPPKIQSKSSILEPFIRNTNIDITAKPNQRLYSSVEQTGMVEKSTDMGNTLEEKLWENQCQSSFWHFFQSLWPWG